MTDRRQQTEAELVEFVRSIDVPAPQSLHRSVQSLIAGARRPRRRPARASVAIARGVLSAPRLAAAGAAVAALVLAIVLAVGGGSRKGLSLRDAAALTLMPATAAAPRESPSSHAKLAVAVDGVSFPYWQVGLGWRSTGSRSDRVAGRLVTTVLYANREGRQVGYAIVSGLPAPRVSGGHSAVRDGVRYRLLRENGAPVVSWLRAGHLCVVSGRGVSPATLLGLASWQAPASA